MRVLITGICGFVGSQMAIELKRLSDDIEITGVDNLSRPGSEQNRAALKTLGIRWRHADIRNASDLEDLPSADWVIDAAANPSVLAGVVGTSTSRQVLEHNLGATINVLEFCRRVKAGLVMVSTSRVYSLEALRGLPMDVANDAFSPRFGEINETGVSAEGVSEEFSVRPPLSLYGSAKLSSEMLALEYGSAFELPVYVNRCGVLAGAGQFGKADQGIFTYWIHSYRWRRPLKYIGFGGTGHQVRDCLHPHDLAQLAAKQMRQGKHAGTVCNVGGGMASKMSLAQLSRWCEERFGQSRVESDLADRRFDVPWLVLDCARAAALWGWRPSVGVHPILEEIAAHAEQHPNWLELSSDT